MKVARENLRIVLIDDGENDRELLEAALAEAGFMLPLTHYDDAGMALAYFKYMNAKGSLGPHLILLDINMPPIDGIHALRLLREEPATRDLPVIILTGTEDPEQRRKLTKLGIFRFLKKLPDCANVIAALDDFIGFYNHQDTSSAT